MKKYNTRFKSSFYYADGMKDPYLKKLSDSSHQIWKSLKMLRAKPQTLPWYLTQPLEGRECYNHFHVKAMIRLNQGWRTSPEATRTLVDLTIPARTILMLSVYTLEARYSST